LLLLYEYFSFNKDWQDKMIDSPIILI